MKQAIQLQIPFEGVTSPSIPVSGVPAADAHASLVDRAELSLARRAKALLPSLAIAAQAVLCLAVCFALMFLSALIGG